MTEASGAGDGEIQRVQKRLDRERQARREAEEIAERNLRLLYENNQALESARKEAEAANTAKSEFLANISHELRTPLNGVLGMAELLAASELNGEQREHLHILRFSGESLLALINDLLDVSKIEAGQLDLERIGFGLRNCLADSLKTLSMRAHAKKLELAYEVLPDVPDALLGDPGRLRQMVVNLVSNAIKFTERGEVVMRVEVLARQTREILLGITVSDTGIGIPPEQLERIFERFAQADQSTTRKYGGTGLGLAIVSQLAALMHGKVSVHSEVGKGTTFELQVRLGVQSAPAKLMERADPALLHNLRVLIIDDNSTNRRILVEMLRASGMRAESAELGAKGLEAWSAARRDGDPFRIVVLDHHMPDLDGFQVAERMRAEGGPQALSTVLFLTSGGSRGDISRCQSLGIGAYLSKPSSQSELFEAIRQILGTAAAGGDGSTTITRHLLSETRTRRKVLLVEDNAVNQTLASRLLRKRGHEVTIAENGRVALERLQHERFDVVLMDLEMPEMNGFDATAAIRQREDGKHRVPIIAMTAHALTGYRERCLEAGMDGYITKPIQAVQLYDAVESAGRALPTSRREPEAGAVTLDRTAILMGFDSDAALMRQATALFLGAIPAQLSQARMAIGARDLGQLSDIAHAIKGGLCYFNAHAALEAADSVETLTRTGGLDQAAAAFALLERELRRLEPALRGLIAPHD